MFDQVVKFGAYIVDGLREYRQPVFVYLPPHAELRGGAWVVVDPAINTRFMESYADPESRWGAFSLRIAAPHAGRSLQRRRARARGHGGDQVPVQGPAADDPPVRPAHPGAEVAPAGQGAGRRGGQAAAGGSRRAPIRHRHALCLSGRGEEARGEPYPDLPHGGRAVRRPARHGRPHAGQAGHLCKACEGRGSVCQQLRLLRQGIVSWRTSRHKFYWRLRRRLAEERLKTRVLEQGGAELAEAQLEPLLRRWFAADRREQQQFDDDVCVAEWLERQAGGGVVEEQLKLLRQQAVRAKISRWAFGCARWFSMSGSATQLARLQPGAADGQPGGDGAAAVADAERRAGAARGQAAQRHAHQQSVSCAPQSSYGYPFRRCRLIPCTVRPTNPPCPVLPNHSPVILCSCKRTYFCAALGPLCFGVIVLFLLGALLRLYRVTILISELADK